MGRKAVLDCASPLALSRCGPRQRRAVPDSNAHMHTRWLEGGTRQNSSAAPGKQSATLGRALWKPCIGWSRISSLIGRRSTARRISGPRSPLLALLQSGVPQLRQGMAEPPPNPPSPGSGLARDCPKLASSQRRPTPSSPLASPNYRGHDLPRFLPTPSSWTKTAEVQAATCSCSRLICPMPA